MAHGREETLMRVRRLALALVVMLLLAACGSGAEDEATDEAAASEPAVEASEPAAEESEPAAAEAGDTSEAADGVTLETSDTDLGTIVVDSEGMTLYVFDNDSEGTSACTGDCAANWPPLTGEVTAGEGTDEGLLGSTERDDGSMQVTYDGLPLYYFAGDEAAGDTNGQGVGGIWWVIAPDGEKITDEQVSRNDTSSGLGY